MADGPARYLPSPWVVCWLVLAASACSTKAARPNPGSGGSAAGTGGTGAGTGGRGAPEDDSCRPGGSGGVGSVGATGGAAATDAAANAAADAGTDAAATCNAPVTEPPSASIAGMWTFTPEGGAPTQILVPGGGWTKQGFCSLSAATYETRIIVPMLSATVGAPQATLIELGAVNHEATLFVDGAMVGTNITSFTPSVFDVTRFVTPGSEHTLRLQVRGRNGLHAPGTSRKVVPDAAGWSQHIAQGIFRSAMVRVFPDVYISDVFVRPSVANAALGYDVAVTNTSTRSRDVTLSGSLESWNCDPFSYPTVAPVNLIVPAGETRQVTIGPLPWGLGPESYWWPNVPTREDYKAKLHNLRVGLREGTGADAGTAPLHERLVRFGFREVAQSRVDAQNVIYTLNGVRVNFRGDNLQEANYDSIVTDGGRGDAYDTFPGFLPPSTGNRGWPQAVRNYQRLNYNVNRIHQVPAAPYMLDVADELGFMIIDETAIRGSNGDQDFVVGHDNMVAHAQALVLRDRNHPSVVRWSQSNEGNLSTADSVQFENDLYTAIVGLDPTRPVSVDVFQNPASYDALTHPNFSVIPHYLSGTGVYDDAVRVRTDQPYGQGEFIWPRDVTPQGLMWFATSTMSMRNKNASDIRPYTLLSGWASVVPGVRTSMMRLEPTYPERAVNPPLFGEDNLPDPWANPILIRIQRAFNPVLVADVDYWMANRMSNAAGDWPTNVPGVARDVVLPRTLVIFNDTFAGTRIDVTWEMRADSATGAIASTATESLDVPLGARVLRAIMPRTPATGTRCILVLRAMKDGVVLFEDDATTFTLN